MNEKQFKHRCEANGLKGQCSDDYWDVLTHSGIYLAEFHVGRDTFSTRRRFDSFVWHDGTPDDAIALAVKLRDEAEGKQPESPTEPDIVGLKALVSDAISMARHGDYSNGNEHNGIDEGIVQATDIFDELESRAEALSVVLDYEPSLSSTKSDIKTAARELCVNLRLHLGDETIIPLRANVLRKWVQLTEQIEALAKLLGIEHEEESKP